MLVLKSFILYWNIFVMICVEFRLLYISLLVCKRIKFVGFEFKCLLVDSVIKSCDYYGWNSGKIYNVL